MVVCFLLKLTQFLSLEFKGLPQGVDDASNSKEQATTSLKTNSMNVNHVEYKQGFQNDL